MSEQEAAEAATEPTAATAVADPPETPQAPQEDAGKAETDALRRQLAEEQRARKRLEDQQKKAKEEQAAEQGRWQELAQQREQELNMERDERTRVEREARIARLAGRLKFIDPADVVGRVSVEDGADEASVELALERIAQQSPHLVAKEPQARPEIGQVVTGEAIGLAGAPQPPAGKAPLRDLSDTDGMSQQEMVDRMPEIDFLLAQQKR